MKYVKVFKEVFDKSDYIEKNINQLKANDRVIIRGKIDIKDAKTKAGKDYLSVKITDSTGTISQNIWNNLDLYPYLASKEDNEKIVEVCGKISVNGIYKNLEIENIAVVEKETELEKKPEIEELKNELRNRIEKISHVFLRDLVNSVLSRQDVLDRLFVSPATEKTAYNYEGGVAHLMIDTIDMTDTVALEINNSFWPSSLEVNIDLLLASSILSNVGRLFTLKIDEDGLIEKTLQGHLENDTVISRDIVSKEIEVVLNKTNDDGSLKYENPKEFEDLIAELLHIISSSKGRVEFGALVIPRSKHAMILSNISNIVYTKGLFENLERENVLDEKFSRAYNNGRNYYLG